MSTALIDCDRDFASAVKDEDLVQSVFKERGEILRQKAAYQEQIDTLDPQQGGNWPILIRAAWGVGLSDEELCNRLCMNEKTLYAMARAQVFPPEDVREDMGEILGDMAHIHMTVLYEAMNLYYSDYMPAQT